MWHMLDVMDTVLATGHMLHMTVDQHLICQHMTIDQALILYHMTIYRHLIHNI